MLYTLDGRSPIVKGECFIAHNATVIGSVTLEPHSSIWFNCVLRGDCDDLIVGENSNVQDGSVLHTDPGVKLRIGKNVTVGHMAMLHGCDIGDNCVIGIKAVILNRARIGKNCIVGAGALVTEGKEFPEGSLIIGTPAKVARPLTPQEIQFVGLNATHYVQNSKRYLKSFKGVES